MADDTNTTSNHGRPDGAARGNRQGGGRDIGGFRIRLSDNEMQAARALQEAFNLRSTVAVLGFSLRTLAQMLEEGQLDELVARQRAEGGGRPPAPRGERSERRSERRGERDRGPGGRPARVDPFARPSRPGPAPAGEAEAPPATEDPATDAAMSSEEGSVETLIDVDHGREGAADDAAVSAEATPAP